MLFFSVAPCSRRLPKRLPPAQALAGHSNRTMVRCILKPLLDALVGVVHPEEPSLMLPSLMAARSPSDTIDDNDDDDVSNAVVLQHRVSSQSGVQREIVKRLTFHWKGTRAPA